jgi:hypothetical protein
MHLGRGRSKAKPVVRKHWSGALLCRTTRTQKGTACTVCPEPSPRSDLPRFAVIVSNMSWYRSSRQFFTGPAIESCAMHRT